MTTNIDINKEEELKDLRATKVKRGLIALAAVGIGGGVLGFKLGLKLSYKRGFRDGEVFANDQFRYLAGQMIDAIKESKGK